MFTRHFSKLTRVEPGLVVFTRQTNPGRTRVSSVYTTETNPGRTRVSLYRVNRALVQEIEGPVDGLLLGLIIPIFKTHFCYTGFLPVFGPTFVNMYGSTREYSDLPDEFDELNLGIVSTFSFGCSRLQKAFLLQYFFSFFSPITILAFEISCVFFISGKRVIFFSLNVL